jgi:hypothetical protein
MIFFIGAKLLQAQSIAQLACIWRHQNQPRVRRIGVMETIIHQAMRYGRELLGD